MPDAAKQRLQALSQQLVEGIPDAGSFEGMPKIRQVAGDSAGPYVLLFYVLHLAQRVDIALLGYTPGTTNTNTTSTHAVASKIKSPL